MARRGLLATLIHESQKAARAQARAQQAAVREHNASIRQAQQALRAAESARMRLARATEADRKQLAREAKEAHIAAMEAEAEQRNQQLAQVNAEIDSLLSATLGVDDFVDLERFRASAKHPAFDRPDLEIPTPEPDHIKEPTKPTFEPPEQPRGILASLIGKKAHLAAVEKARLIHEEALAIWRKRVEELPARRREALAKHAQAESTRLAQLEKERRRYEEECATRETQVAEQNKRLDRLIADLGYGTREAIQEYISIVLANSVYPEHFPVSHEFEFEPSSAELKLKVQIPGPSEIPTTKAFKYTRAADEIVQTPLPQKACRDRYSSAVHQVALRSIHEVFESDRRGLIKTVSLEVGTQTIDPATGLKAYIPFAVVAAEREAFLKFDLSAVVPASTLDHLGAAVSKDPYRLIPVEAFGVRRS